MAQADTTHQKNNNAEGGNRSRRTKNNVSLYPPGHFYLPDPAPSFWTSLRYLNWMRLLVPLALLFSLWTFGSGGRSGIFQEIDPDFFMAASLAYLAAAVTFFVVLLYWQRRFYVQLFLHIATDIFFITLLMVAAGGSKTGMGVLLLLPVAGAAILSPVLLALFFSAIATLVLLVDSVLRYVQQEQSSSVLVHAAVTGFACFCVALLMNYVARRLVRQEFLAEQRGQDLQAQLAVNRLIVEDMPDGVVVFGPTGEIRLTNPAALQLLGDLPVPGVQPTAGWLFLQQKFQLWRQEATWVNEVFDFDGQLNAQAVAGYATGSRRRVRARFVAPLVGELRTGEYLVFLEDMGVVEARAQQLKLAAMGRLAASIAHEIRNPLSAVRHAGALLAEDAQHPTQQKLTRIIEMNAQRINRIVEDILQLSRRDAAPVVKIGLVAFLSEFVREFCFEQDIPMDRIQLKLEIPNQLEIQFDPIQLRRVFVNLVTNALRFASDRSGAVCVFAFLHGRFAKNGYPQVEFGVADDGPGLAADVREHLFEPFYTTDARGTGLGLYIARELCLTNQATLNYTQVAELLAFAPEAFCIRSMQIQPRPLPTEVQTGSAQVQEGDTR